MANALRFPRSRNTGSSNTGSNCHQRRRQSLADADSAAPLSPARPSRAHGTGPNTTPTAVDRHGGALSQLLAPQLPASGENDVVEPCGCSPSPCACEQRHMRAVTSALGRSSHGVCRQASVVVQPLRKRRNLIAHGKPCAELTGLSVGVPFAKTVGTIHGVQYTLHWSRG